jgi:hypothetical protein
MPKRLAADSSILEGPTYSEMQIVGWVLDHVSASLLAH